MVTCKCGAATYEAHLKSVRNGYPGHTFSKGAGKGNK